MAMPCKTEYVLKLCFFENCDNELTLNFDNFDNIIIDFYKKKLTINEQTGTARQRQSRMPGNYTKKETKAGTITTDPPTARPESRAKT